MSTFEAVPVAVLGRVCGLTHTGTLETPLLYCSRLSILLRDGVVGEAYPKTRLVRYSRRIPCSKAQALSANATVVFMIEDYYGGS